MGDDSAIRSDKRIKIFTLALPQNSDWNSGIQSAVDWDCEPFI
jgi:hypothetical protein